MGYEVVITNEQFYKMLGIIKGKVWSLRIKLLIEARNLLLFIQFLRIYILFCFVLYLLVLSEIQIYWLGKSSYQRVCFFIFLSLYYFWIMASSIIGDAKYQELNMSFTFDEQNEDKKIINAIADHTPYQL